MRKLIILLLLASAAYYFYGVFTKGKATAAPSVDTFHQQFNSGQYATIYSAATPAFRNSAPQPQFIQFLQAVRRKLGAFKSATQSGWHTNATTSGTFVVLNYTSQFEQGSAVEIFTFVVSGTQATLQGYNINSPALIIK